MFHATHKCFLKLFFSIYKGGGAAVPIGRRGGKESHALTCTRGQCVFASKKKKEKKLERAQHHQTKKMREVMLDPRRKVTTGDQMYQMMKITFFFPPVNKSDSP